MRLQLRDERDYSTLTDRYVEVETIQELLDLRDSYDDQIALVRDVEGHVYLLLCNETTIV